MSSVAARTASKPLPQILKTFRQKELLKLQEAAPSSSSSNPVAIKVRNPFLPTKSASGKWRAPEYSLRRQKELVKAAKTIGLDLTQTLPVGPKTLGLVGAQRLQEAIARTSAVNATEKSNAESQAENTGSSTKPSQEKDSEGSPSSLSSSSSSLLPPSSTGETISIIWSNVLTRKLAAKASIVASTRPGERVLRLYGGRKKMFKGHKWERNLLKRKGQIRVRMRDMQKRIRRFHHVRPTQTPTRMRD